MKRLGSKAAKQSQVKANMQRSATSAEDVEHAMAAAAATEGGKHWKKKKRELEKKEKARVVDAVAARKKTAQALAHATATEKAEPLQRSFWPQGDDGQHDQGAPSEKLKRMRQSIGVRVSTGGGSCPAPLGALGLTDARLPDVFRGVFSAAGLTSPTPVQRQAWPALLHGLDCLVVAPTGSGKTLAYLLPIVPHVLAQRRPQPGEGPLAVILVPTRELAQQVARAALPLRKLCGLRCVALYGGLLRHERQAQVVDLLEHSTHIVVATPGRLADLASEKALEADPGEPSTTGSEVGNNTTSTSSTKQDAVLPLGRVSFLVLDEADRMLTMGFETQLAAIAQECRADRVTCCFSATFPQALRLQADALLRHPCVTVRVAAADVVAPEAGDFALTSAAAAAAAPEEEENSAFGGDSVVSQNNHTGGSSSSSSCNMLGSVAMSSAVAHVVAVLPAPHAKPGALLKYLVAVSGPRKLCPSVLVFCNRAPVAEALAAFLAMQPRDPPPPPPPPPSSSSLEEAATPTTSEPNHKSSPAADLGSSSSSGTTGDDTASSEAGAVDPKKAPKGEAWEYDDVEGPLVDGTAGLTADARRAARMRANSGGRGSQRYGRALPSSGGSSSDGRRAWLRVGILHGGMPQKQRDEALRDLSSGKLQVLVATDLASRGLHVPNLDHVVRELERREWHSYMSTRVGKKEGSIGSWRRSVFISFVLMQSPAAHGVLLPFFFPLTGKLRRSARRPRRRCLPPSCRPNGPPRPPWDLPYSGGACNSTLSSSGGRRRSKKRKPSRCRRSSQGSG